MQTTAEKARKPKEEPGAPQTQHPKHRARDGGSGRHRSHGHHHHRTRYSRRAIMRVLVGHARVMAIELAIGVVVAYLLVLYLNSANAPTVP